MKPIIECVPNFSEGRNPDTLKKIADAIARVSNVRLLHIDAGKAANRTVFTFAGAPEAVVQAAFEGIKVAKDCIDMRLQTGEHPRIGATDVCPLIPVAGISMAETTQWAHRLAEKVATLDIPIYLYEQNAATPERRNLADIRRGEYEGLVEKMRDPAWQPDFAPPQYDPRTGATVIGARPFLIAYNVNLNTTDPRIAQEIAADVRESGRLIIENGVKKRVAGACKTLKAIGWYIEEYGCAQVSMNVTNLDVTPVHVAFEACQKAAAAHGVTVTGSELIGLLPQRVLLEAGAYFLSKNDETIEENNRNQEEIMRRAVDILGLDALAPFRLEERVIEILLEDC